MGNHRLTGFIVSSPRSGSTWLQRILCNLPRTTCVETRSYGQFFELWHDLDGRDRPRMTIDRFAELLSGYVAPPGWSKRQRDNFTALCTPSLAHAVYETISQISQSEYIFEKITPYIGTSDLVLEYLARDHRSVPVIQLVRDGRDVATSGFFHWLGRNKKPTARDKFFLTGKKSHLKRFFEDDELKKWCSYWKEPILAFERCLHSAPQLRYEQMKESPADAVERALADIPATYSSHEIARACEEAAFLRMASKDKRGKNAQTRHVRKGQVGDWKNYFTRRDGKIFIEETGDLLIRYGYESSDSWVESLPKKLGLRAGERTY